MADKRAALYLRVSTDSQTTDNQRQALLEEASRRGWQIASEYRDHGVSGAKSRDKRPQLDAMLRDAAKGRFDVVMVWALDRLGRSLADLLTISRELEQAGVDVFFLRETIDTTTPAGRLYFHIMGAIAQFERERIQERIKAGVARARKAGKRIGRPKLAYERAQAVRTRLGRGEGVQKIARELGVGAATVQNIKRELRAAMES